MGDLRFPVDYVVFLSKPSSLASMEGAIAIAPGPIPNDTAAKEAFGTTETYGWWTRITMRFCRLEDAIVVCYIDGEVCG